jgi:V-type H+-transporting ATPase 16kDa proteolipid subunit
MMPPILASIVSIYGLVVAVIISNNLIERLPLFTGFLQLGAGISVGLSGMAAGYVSIHYQRRECRREMKLTVS